MQTVPHTTPVRGPLCAFRTQTTFDFEDLQRESEFMRVPGTDADSDAGSDAGGPGAINNKKHYRTLGVSTTASASEIKRAYHKLALRFHPDKNPGQSDRFNEINNAYTILSDPRKKQLYDQFGEQGVQISDMMAQQGLPPWLLSPTGRCAVCSSIVGVILLFLVLLPLFVLLRADATITWAWAIVLTPVWLANLAWGAGLLLLVCKPQHEESRHDCRGVQAVYRTATYALVLASEILLAIKLDNPDHAPLPFIGALIPLLLTFVPGVARNLYALVKGVYQRVRPREGVRPPTNEQLAGPARACAGRLLLASTITLAALVEDGILHLSWWLVLLPGWMQCALLVHQWYGALKAHMLSRDGTEEERASKAVMLGLAAFGGSLGLTCFLLLSLRVGGPADYPAWVIGMPVFGLLGLIVCCGACCACCAAMVQSISKQNPPYAEVRTPPDEEAAEAAPPPTPTGVQTPARADPSEQSPRRPETRASDQVPTDWPPSSSEGGSYFTRRESRTTSATDVHLAGLVDLAQQLSERVPGESPEPPLDVAWAVPPSPAIGGSPQPSARTAPPATTPATTPSGGLSVREMRKALSARGIAHEHCLERAELEALMRS